MLENGLPLGFAWRRINLSSLAARRHSLVLPYGTAAGNRCAISGHQALLDWTAQP
jgi:hypothetical protein